MKANNNIFLVPNFWIASILWLIVFFTTGCSTSLTNSLPNVNGKANEIIVVADMSIWDSNEGDSLRHVFGIPVPGLPQEEPYFDMVHIDVLKFTKSVIYKKHRNICRIFVSDTLQNAVKVGENVWAMPQLVMDISASCSDSLIALLGREAPYIRQLIVEKERNRLRDTYDHSINLTIKNKLASDHHIALTVPNAWSLDVNNQDFVWMSTEQSDNVQIGVLVWHYPYTDEYQFSKEGLIEARNRFVQANVPGPQEGSYMSTDTTNYETIYEPYEKDGKFFVRMRGLWFTENYYMGGPFVSLSTVNEATNEIVTLDAYVYAPRKDKRNYVRQVETILSTLQTNVK